MQEPGPAPDTGATTATPDTGATTATPDTGATTATPDTGATTATGYAVLDAALDKAVAIPTPYIHAHVDRLRRKHPGAAPQQLIAILEREYLLAVSASGGAVGAAAATPAVGTGVALALTASEIATFFAASAVFALAVADVHGIAVEDLPRRRALLLATVLGNPGAKTISAETGLPTQTWARSLLTNMPTATVRRVNRALAKRMVRRQAARHGTIALGRVVPFGIGAVIGVAGARALGRTVVAAARQAFGPPPARFPQVIEGRTTPKQITADDGAAHLP